MRWNVLFVLGLVLSKSCMCLDMRYFKRSTSSLMHTHTHSYNIIEREKKEKKSSSWVTCNAIHPNKAILDKAEERSEERASSSKVRSCAALIAGTTIGGGFLALPTATAPLGALPATIGLFGCWLYLLYCAYALSSTIFLIKENSETSGNTDNPQQLSIFSIVKTCLGSTAGTISALTFVVLMVATLVAQFSKIGILLGKFPFFLTLTKWTNGNSAAIILVSSILSLLTYKCPANIIDKINNTLTATLLLSFTLLVAVAGGSGWDINGLKRCNFEQLLITSRSIGSQNPGTSAPWAIPIFIQLLV